MFDLLTQSTISSSLFALSLLAVLFGLVLGYAVVKFKVDGDPIVDQIDNLLPQTQCGQCGFPGCKPYAESIANGDAINKCPPGGQTTVNQLAELLGVEAPELDESHGEEKDKRVIAYIREDECIGCTKCIQACPVDAILGAAKQMHTVIVDECTGCDLCVEPCPVDCIDLLEIDEDINTWSWKQPDLIATDKRGVIS
ncbi:electron transport complex subunit RsxB [Umboniibacter marinipuniceus]|uniref:Ion-translocating oxidoreductase complex subunit B n=1 Tax=Umboniibacter marinipuniceus TaxID=569599 RepID=A0A3M0A945_9GAMM|nr:electron transport complex subunit RsxB [Umboniibacter marinipuniceus]RMA81390.1 electron transport complex protein RnfB [Umboniibacter marinipuniceus]